jgi:uncharacterized protein
MGSLAQLSPDTSSQRGSLARIAKKHPVAMFVGLAYFLGWGMATPRVLSWLGLVSFNVPNWWIAASFYAPCVAALLVQWITQRNLKVCRLYASWGRLALGIVVGCLLVLFLNSIVPALLAERDPLRSLNWRIFFSLAAYHFSYAEPLTPIGEEIGWRGFALPRLQEQFGPVWASVLVGLIWTGFMLPGLGLVQMWSVAGIVLYAVNLIALSVEITFAANLSGFSIIVAVIMHTLASSQGGYLMRGLIGHAYPRPHWQQIWSLSNLVVPACLLVATRGRLGAPRATNGKATSP